MEHPVKLRIILTISSNGSVQLDLAKLFDAFTNNNDLLFRLQIGKHLA